MARNGLKKKNWIGYKNITRVRDGGYTILRSWPDNNQSWYCFVSGGILIIILLALPARSYLIWVGFGRISLILASCCHLFVRFHLHTLGFFFIFFVLCFFFGVLWVELSLPYNTWKNYTISHSLFCFSFPFLLPLWYDLWELDNKWVVKNTNGKLLKSHYWLGEG